MSYFLRRCWGFNLVMKFRCGGSAGLSWCCGKWVNLQSVGEERNAYRRMLLWLVQYKTRDKCLQFCCNDFLLMFLNCRFMLTCTFKSKVQPFCCHGNNMRQAGQLHNCCCKRETLSLVLGHTGQRMFRTAWRDCSRNVLVLQLLCRWGMIRGTRLKITGQHWISISQPCLSTLWNRQIVSCAQISKFYWQ